MVMRNPIPKPIPEKPLEPQPEELNGYDEVVEESFPASDPPPGVIKVGPRKARRTSPPPGSSR